MLQPLLVPGCCKADGGAVPDEVMLRTVFEHEPAISEGVPNTAQTVGEFTYRCFHVIP